MLDALRSRSRRRAGVVLLTAAGLAAGPAAAATDLSPGDIVITGVNSDNPDQFVFIPLVDLDVGTQITFTDSGLQSDRTTFRASEGAVRYEASTAVAAGTAILYSGVGGDFTDADDSGVGLNGFFLSTSGDQVIAFQGASSAPEFIFAVQTNSTGWQTEATNSNTSALPAGLTDGDTAAAVGQGAGAGDEWDNAEYDHSVTSGDAATLRAAVADNGNWAGSSSAIALNTDGFTLGPSGPDTEPPALTGSSPGDGEDNVASDLGTVTLSFNEAVVDADLAAATLLCDGSDVRDGTASVAGNRVSLPVTALPFGAACTVTLPAGSLTDTADPANATTAPIAIGFTVEAALAGCGDGNETRISTIQGNSASPNWPQTPQLGAAHTVEAVVTAAFPGTAGLNGFYIQEEAADWDTDPETSEGLFIYDPAGLGSGVGVGTVVRVTGTVSEFRNNTQLSSLTDLTVCATGVAPAVTTLSFPEAQEGDLELVENMSVVIPHDMLVAQNYFLGRYGQLTLAGPDDAGQLTRPYQPTNEDLPGSAAAIARADENARRLLVLDDGSAEQNPSVVPYLGAPPPMVLRAGDTVSNLFGVLDEGQISASSSVIDYRLQPLSTLDPVFTQTNLRTAAPDAVGGGLRVAVLNVLNYFLTTQDQGDICGPSEIMECRGAYDATEQTRQRDKLVAALAGMDADIIALVELENTPGVEPAADLAAAAAGATGRAYAAVPTGTIGADAIRTGFIYDGATVTPVGTPAVLDNTVDIRAIDTKNRPALAMSFTEQVSGELLTVVVNHFKSKGSDCDTVTNPGEIVDPDTGDGQGNCNLTRVSMANAVIDWLETDPTGTGGDPDYLVVGDLNAYAEEDPVAAFKDAGYAELVADYVGAGAYSYVFDGQSGYLDHALATPSMADQVTGVTEWHINADEPNVISYEDFYNPPGYYSADPYRASDHDPLIIGLDLGAEAAVPGDLNGDGGVDGADYALFRQALGSRPGGARWNPDADYDGDDVVSYRDYVVWYGYWQAAQD